MTERAATSTGASRNAATGKIKAGIIGTGNISGVYLQNGKRFESLEVVACADLDLDRAREKAAAHGVRAMSVAELLADPDIELVINLTVPQAHAPVAIQALEAGKHVYMEKPLAITCEEGRQVLELAQRKGLKVGCAPDTFLGGGIQTCIKLIGDGLIGEPIGATAFMMSGGHESWHPDPAFYYRKGGGPMFDMGPYYLTTLVAMLGPIRRVTGSAQQLRREITVENPRSPRYGETVPVTAPMNAAATLDFACGAVATLQAAKESFGYTPRFEIYGTEGILYANDPNAFGGTIRIQRRDGEIREFPLSHGFTDNCRGIGLADMAYAIRTGRPHRASGQLARHVLDALLGVMDASRTERIEPGDR